MTILNYKKQLSIGMWLFVTSSMVRVLIILLLLLFLWVLITWSSQLI